MLIGTTNNVVKTNTVASAPTSSGCTGAIVSLTWSSQSDAAMIIAAVRCALGSRAVDPRVHVPIVETNVYGHTQCNIPYLVRTAQSSHCRPRQYYGGGPRGNPGCRRLSFLPPVFFAAALFVPRLLSRPLTVLCGIINSPRAQGLAPPNRARRRSRFPYRPARGCRFFTNL
eukprot:COSAG03_NODE_1279_length_4412_cov_20.059355_5_plen_171_part_00